VTGGPTAKVAVLGIAVDAAWRFGEHLPPCVPSPPR
jgi:hypothetical protein